MRAVDRPQGRQLVARFQMIRPEGWLVQGHRFLQHRDGFADAAGLVAHHTQAVNRPGHAQRLGMRQGRFDFESVPRHLFHGRKVALIPENIGQRIQALHVPDPVVRARRQLDGRPHCQLRRVQLGGVGVQVIRVDLFALRLRQQQPHLNSLGHRVSPLLRIHRSPRQMELRGGVVAGFQQTFAFGAVPVTVQTLGLQARRLRSGPKK